MTIHTEYYGEIEYENKDLITFTDGLFGFQELKKYLPLYLNDEDDSVILMQSVEQPEIAFVTMNPLYLCPDYSPNLTPEELSYLSVSDSNDLSYYVICVMKDDYLENTVNLKCPLAINPQTRVGMQLILEGSPYGFSHKLSSFPAIADLQKGE